MERVPIGLDVPDVEDAHIVVSHALRFAARVTVRHPKHHPTAISDLVFRVTLPARSNAEIIEDYPDDKYSPSCLVLGITQNHRPLHIQACYCDDKTVKIVTLDEPEVAEWIDLRIRRRP